MSTLLIIISIIVGIILLLIIIASFTSSAYQIEEHIMVNSSPQAVFDYIKNIKNGIYFNKWEMADPLADRSYEGIDGTTGFIIKWDSKNGQVGAGAQEIIKIVEGQSVRCEIRFERPFKATSYVEFNLSKASEHETKVSWKFEGNNNLMMKTMHLILNLKKLLAKDMVISLNNLKNILEK
jgi:hypothetical protein